MNLLSPFKFQEKSGPVYITGPCSAETREQVLETAKILKEQNTCHFFRAGIWKPRTRPNSFEGVGVDGLKWLQEVKTTYGLPVACEVAMPSHVEACLEHKIDLLWIGARTTASPFAMQEIANALKGENIPVLVKNPINAELSLWLGGIERLEKAGINQLGAIHRGFSGIEHGIYRNLPMWHVPMELKRLYPELPVICDPSHITGQRDLIGKVSQYAMDLNFDGLMIETHPNPEKALSDASQQVTPVRLREILTNLIIKHESSHNKNYENQLEFLRAKIDRIDDELIELLKNRSEISRQIGILKKAENVTIFQQTRMDELMKLRIERAKSQGVSVDLVEKIFTQIHSDSVNIQADIFNQEN